MTVSDPDIKLIKDSVAHLTAEYGSSDGKTTSTAITDNNGEVAALCANLEMVLRRGLVRKQRFPFGARDYWHVCSDCSKRSTSLKLKGFVDEIRKNPKVCTAQGRGRLLIRYCLQMNLLDSLLDCIIRSDLSALYDQGAILGNEILSSLLRALLLQLDRLDFKLQLDNASFLDDSWLLPVFERVELLPPAARAATGVDLLADRPVSSAMTTSGDSAGAGAADDLGLYTFIFNGRILIVDTICDGSAASSGRICAGDVLEEVCGFAVRNSYRGDVRRILKRHRASSPTAPIEVAVSKCLTSTGQLYKPIIDLLEQSGQDVIRITEAARNSTKSNIWEDHLKTGQGDASKAAARHAQAPPHALLPSDDFERVPVHDSLETAAYWVTFLGSCNVGPDGSMRQIESAIGRVLDAALVKQPSLAAKLSTAGAATTRQHGETSAGPCSATSGVVESEKDADEPLLQLDCNSQDQPAVFEEKKEPSTSQSSSILEPSTPSPADETPSTCNAEQLDWLVGATCVLQIGEQGVVILSSSQASQYARQATCPFAQHPVMPQQFQPIIEYSYPQISSCGRRTPEPKIFCFIAGETTCTLANEFRAFVFTIDSPKQCRDILCALAQGFERTHWMT